MRRLAERGFTLVEIMIVVAIIALLAAIAIPNVLRGRTTANESAAIGNVRALISSLEMFRSVNNSYPTEWDADMFGTDCTTAAPTPDYGPPSFCGEMDTANLAVQGFNYRYADSGTPPTTYTLVVTPVTPGTTGTRSFYADQNGLVHHCPEQTTTVTATVGNGAGWATIDAPPDADPATAGIQACD